MSIKRLKERLRTIDGGKMLDVATSEGGYTEFLATNLRSYTSITGVDIAADRIEKARQNVPLERVSFAVMDAADLDFEDASFDTVAMSHSLHHLAEVPQVLAEVMRVLKSGGLLILQEMYQDHQTEPQLTGMYIHHWIAAIDTALGTQHHEVTLTRRKIEEYVETLDLTDAEYFELLPEKTDPFDSTEIKALKQACDTYAERLGSDRRFVGLLKKGELLKRRLDEVGVLPPNILCALGRK